MSIVNKREPILLGLIDLVILVFSLYLTLSLRYREIPDDHLISTHLLPFTIIFIYSIITFYISGLYGRNIFLKRSVIQWSIIRAQIVNGLIAVAMFYFIPVFSVTPKINLFFYLLLATAFLILWRTGTYSLFSLKHKYPTLVIGSDVETEEIIQEMKINTSIGLVCNKKIDPATSPQTIISSLENNGSTFQYIVADVNNNNIGALLPELYKKFFLKTQIIDIHDLYEQIFNRIPLSRMNYIWIMSHISSVSPVMYDFVKRLIDIFFGLLICLVTILVYPFVAIAIMIEDRGSVFIKQERIGKNGRPIHFYKFRSMQRNDHGKWVNESEKTENKVTRVGQFIRKTRIDELPQGLSVLKGDMSLIGPRSDIVGLGERLLNEIPYYSVRNIVKPGLSGWAQINQSKPPQSVEETKIRLSYDLYYIKHRSISLDVQIILKTLKTLLSREGV